MKIKKSFAWEDASIEYLAFANLMDYQPCYLFYRYTHPQVHCSYPPHIHPNFELIIPAGCCYRCMINSRPVTVRKKEALIIQPGQLHEDIYQKGEPFHCVRFEFNSARKQSLSRLFAQHITPEQQVLNIQNFRSVVVLLRLLRQEAMCDMRSNYDIQNSLFQALFFLSLASCPEHFLNPEYFRHSRDNYRQGTILAAFEHYLFSAPALKDLCRFCDMTPSLLSRRCHDLFSLAPLKAFMEYKIRHVKQKMIDEPDITLKEICSLYGFKNQFHFSRIFKHYAGLSPSEFKSGLK